MERYIGIDVHKQSSTIAVMSSSGKRLASHVVETNGEALVSTMQGIRGILHVCLEEGTQSAWLHELLSPHVRNLVVTVPPSTRGNKDDSRDAWALAEALRLGAVKTHVYKAPQHLADLRNAVRAHLMAVSDVVRAKNRLMAVYRSRGVQMTSDVYNADKREDCLAQLSGSHRLLAEAHARKLDALDTLRQEAEAWLLEESKKHPIVRILLTVPGLGPIRVAQIVAITADPFRFRSCRQYWSYCGFGVVMRSSSDWKMKDEQWARAQVMRTCGLAYKRNPLLKAVFKGAAMTVIHQMHDHPLHQAYERSLRNGVKPNLAALTLARRIAAIVLAMWKHKEEYDLKRHTLTIRQA
jgi:transposase